ncbi:hypothetical protein HHL17_10875 [Chitinophaga sp. G-6-1-13]|uniref:Uncharacterized protein n=1 Tax=Chitinophaga fulva TaxID=2728842 RepID=A0A848GHM3_9BACT|nr:hypothetical protein [Chitinophaga fulva]NML37696.1 hypothetical protein [Chitinophaga fulva]
MKKEIGLLIDNSDGQEDIFNWFASEIEQSIQEGEHDFGLSEIMDKVQHVEMSLQDLSEKIDVSNENEPTSFSVAIKRTGDLLRKWMVLFLNRNKNPNVVYFFNLELDNILEYITVDNISNKSIPVIERDFSVIFLIQGIDLGDTVRKMSRDGLFQLSDSLPTLSKKIIDKFVVELKTTTFSTSQIAFRDLMLGDTPMSQIALKGLRHADASEEFVQDGEEVEYLWLAHLWIDTTDAGKANKFMHLISSTLCYIDNVKVELVSAKVGSLMQNWIVTVKGWFTKENILQILAKVVKAIEAFGLGRHIESVEKTKADRRKIEEDTKRMMSEEQTRQMNELAVAEKIEDVKSKMLDNKLKELEYQQKLSDMLASGLMETDANFSFMMNNCLVVKRENGRLTTGNIEDLDATTGRSETDTSQDPPTL